MSDPKFDSIADVKAWADKLEFINALPKDEYERFKGLYSRIMFFDDFFDKLWRFQHIIKKMKTMEPLLAEWKSMIDDGSLKRLADTVEKVATTIDYDDMGGRP